MCRCVWWFVLFAWDWVKMAVRAWRPGRSKRRCSTAQHSTGAAHLRLVGGHQVDRLSARQVAPQGGVVLQAIAGAVLVHGHAGDVAGGVACTHMAGRGAATAAAAQIQSTEHGGQRMGRRCCHIGLQSGGSQRCRRSLLLRFHEAPT